MDDRSPRAVATEFARIDSLVWLPSLVGLESGHRHPQLLIRSREFQVARVLVVSVHPYSGTASWLRAGKLPLPASALSDHSGCRHRSPCAGRAFRKAWEGQRRHAGSLRQHPFSPREPETSALSRPRKCPHAIKSSPPQRTNFGAITKISEILSTGSLRSCRRRLHGSRQASPMHRPIWAKLLRANAASPPWIADLDSLRRDYSGPVTGESMKQEWISL